MTAPHPVIGVLRAGMLLGFGWVVAAGLAWAAFGVLWAMLILFGWLVLQRFFHRAVQRLGEAITRTAPRDPSAAPDGETPC